MPSVAGSPRGRTGASMDVVESSLKAGHIPSDLPDLLKLFTKAAIRTQPTDLNIWAKGYFDCLLSGDYLPVKDRMELPGHPVSKAGLTPGLLRILHKQLAPLADSNTKVDLKLLRQKWCHLCLKEDGLAEVLTILGNPKKKVQWLKFLGLMAGTMSESMEHTFRILCLVMANIPGKDSIHLDVFNTIYDFMARLDDVDPDHMEAVVNEMSAKADRQNGRLYFTNFDLSSGAGYPLTPDSSA